MENTKAFGHLKTIRARRFYTAIGRNTCFLASVTWQNTENRVVFCHMTKYYTILSGVYICRFVLGRVAQSPISTNPGLSVKQNIWGIMLINPGLVLIVLRTTRPRSFRHSECGEVLETRLPPNWNRYIFLIFIDGKRNKMLSKWLP